MLWAKIRYEEFRASKYVKFDFTKNIFTLWSWYSHILRKYNINMIIIMGTKFIVLSSVEYVMSQNLKRTIVRKIKVRKKNFSNFSVNPKLSPDAYFLVFKIHKDVRKRNIWTFFKSDRKFLLISLLKPGIIKSTNECHMRNEK